MDATSSASCLSNCCISVVLPKKFSVETLLEYVWSMDELNSVRMADISEASLS